MKLRYTLIAAGLMMSILLAPGQVSAAEEDTIDLMGDWYFRTASAISKDGLKGSPDDIDIILSSEWDKWDVVQPGLEPVEGDTALTESESDLLVSDMTAETEPKE